MKWICQRQQNVTESESLIEGTGGVGATQGPCLGRGIHDSCSALLDGGVKGYVVIFAR